MTKEFIEKEVEKVFKSYPQPLNMAMVSAWILGNLKGQALKVLDVKDHSTLADYYVLASATNPTQASAMVDEIGRIARKQGVSVLSVEGRNSADWVLIDLGQVIVHIFSEKDRSVYNLDGLYKDAKSVQIPEEYYFSTPESVPEDEGGGFF
jgi:ribosome-associated protein